MDLEKTSHFANIGTFCLTVAMALMMVWPLLPKKTVTSNISTQASAGKNSVQPTSPSPSARAEAFYPWAMALVLGGAIVVAGVLQFFAARVRRVPALAARV